jgi:hypothetical protein
VGFEGLKYLFHDHTLTKQIRETNHDHGVQHVDFQVILISHMKAVKWDPFDKSDPRHELGFSIIHIAPVADGESEID